MSKWSATHVAQVMATVFLSLFLLGTLLYGGLILFRAEIIPPWVIAVISSAITFSLHALGVGNGVAVANGTAERAVTNLISAQKAGLLSPGVHVEGEIHVQPPLPNNTSTR